MWAVSYATTQMVTLPSYDATKEQRAIHVVDLYLFTVMDSAWFLYFFFCRYFLEDAIMV